MKDVERTDFIRMFTEIVNTGRTVTIRHGYKNWYVEVKDPEIYAYSEVSLGHAIQAAHRLVFR